MNRERGFTLIELLVVMAAMGASSLALATAARGVHRENEASKAYCSDLEVMRRAARQLRADLRNASSIEELSWNYDGDRVSRNDRVVAKNIREFEVRADGKWATARAVVGTGAEISVRVRMRNAGRKR